jgi:hypothetical protein
MLKKNLNGLTNISVNNLTDGIIQMGEGNILNANQVKGKLIASETVYTKYLFLNGQLFDISGQTQYITGPIGPVGVTPNFTVQNIVELLFGQYPYVLLDSTDPYNLKFTFGLPQAQSAHDAYTIGFVETLTPGSSNYVILDISNNSLNFGIATGYNGLNGLDAIAPSIEQFNISSVVTLPPNTDGYVYINNTIPERPSLSFGLPIAQFTL